MRYADDRHFAHAFVLEHDGLDVRGKHVLPARDDHVFLAIHERQKAVRVDFADIAGPEPARAVRMRPGRLDVGVVVVMVAGHHVRRGTDDLTGFAGFEHRIVVAENREPLAGRGPADRLDVRHHVFGRQDRDEPFRQAVQFDEVSRQTVHDRALQRRR